MTSEKGTMKPTHRKWLWVGGAIVAAAAIVIVSFAGTAAINAKVGADKVYAQHHPVGVTPGKRAAAEAMVKQEAAAAEQKREESNAKAEAAAAAPGPATGSGKTPVVTYTPPPQPQVAANRAMPAGQGDPASPAMSTTGLFAENFAKELVLARNMVSKSTAQPVIVKYVPDDCMESWTHEHLHDYDGKSALGVTTVCGKQVAIIAGAGGIDEKILLFGSTQPSGSTDIKRLLLESTGASASFASAASKDGKTVVMIASVAE